MSTSLARSAGTVGALVAGVTLVAGAWPAFAAAPADPTAGEKEATKATVPAVGPPTGLAKGRDTATPAADKGPAPARARQPAPVAAPASAPAAPAAPASAAKGRGHGVVSDRGSRGPAADVPAAAPGRAAAPRSRPPAVGPVVPVARPVAVSAPAPVMGPHVPRPSALATAGSRSGRAQVAAADALPLRPSGAEPIVLPASAARPQPRSLPVDLGTALPTVAAKTAEAVARTPEWPLGIAGVVLIFLLVQNRIDRRDPKLIQARLEDEAPLEFTPLSGRPQVRLVTAAV